VTRWAWPGKFFVMKDLVRIGLLWSFLAQLSLSGFAQAGIITTYAGPAFPVNGAQAITRGQNGATYTVTISNVFGAGLASGTVTAHEPEGGGYKYAA